MKTLTLSVIMPVYNGGKFISKAIESVLKQTEKNLELIIINDGSTDNTEMICKKYQKVDERIIYIYQKNAGVSVARNKALNMVRGKYIGFVDSDDYVSEDMYEYLIKLLNDNNVDVSICGYYICDENYKIINKINKDNVFIFNNEEAISELISDNSFRGFMCNKLYKKEVFNNIKFPLNITLAEDMLINFKIFINVNNIVYSETPKYFYIQHSQSATHSSDIIKNLECFIVWDEIRSKLLNKYPALDIVCNDTYKSLIYYILKRMLIYSNLWNDDVFLELKRRLFKILSTNMKLKDVCYLVLFTLPNNIIRLLPFNVLWKIYKFIKFH